VTLEVGNIKVNFFNDTMILIDCPCKTLCFDNVYELRIGLD